MSSTLLNPVGFQDAPGWEHTAVSLAPELLSNNAVTWSSNVGLDPDRGTWPTNLVPTLPETGVVVFVSTAMHVDDPESYPPRELPLRLEDGYFIAAGYQGQPASHVSTALIYAFAAGRYVFVQIYYGATTPSEEMFAEAQAQVQRLTL